MERDDLIVNDGYAMAAHHSEEAGVAIRKKIWFVTVLLTLITAVEVAMGVYFKRSEAFTWTAIKWTFIVLTLVKAAYIVLVFMHLGDERSNMKKAIMAPYILFIGYLIFIAITEGFGHLESFTTFH
ncbi:MAG: cytochrome C oxidase subunit IV family protein [Bacteroidetes bacterium]|nr:cytochrome C oxidase subunit IV family protein [Bacteroidota bacterium]MDA0904139.1 cytochrome C oxidase subunit IV family protein [Bacteroidota bacterium]MDA1242663.1 cytochrome C oxidase subunit IV family protein [Bacteroidota bacterium]